MMTAAALTTRIFIIFVAIMIVAGGSVSRNDQFAPSFDASRDLATAILSLQALTNAVDHPELLAGSLERAIDVIRTAGGLNPVFKSPNRIDHDRSSGLDFSLLMPKPCLGDLSDYSSLSVLDHLIYASLCFPPLSPPPRSIRV